MNNTLSRCVRLLALLGALVLPACLTVSRKPAPAVVIAQVTPAGFPGTVRFLGLDRDFMVAHAQEAQGRLRAAARGKRLNILALSGGGTGGAFGAGALAGLSRGGDRPQFHLVTGVSAGALLAPFAFLGPDWDPQLIDAFDTGRSEHLLRSRGIGIFFRPGLYQSAPLVSLVNHFVTDRLITGWRSCSFMYSTLREL
jgi:hypothetical protein